jgi:membrane protein DedA with SNARE-associated domain/membrane-associated phospholipid phosphatase
MSGFGQAVQHWLAQYGYAGVAIGVFLESAGVPVPGEAALLAAGFAASRGTLSLPAIMAVAAVAGVLGDNLGFWVGRRLGRPWLERNGRWILLTPARLQRMDHFFARFGAPAVGLARFVAGVRVVAAVSAGVAGMRWRAFAIYNVAGAMLWSVVTTLEGYAFGRGWSVVAGRFGPLGTVVFAVLPLTALTAWIFWQFRTRAFAGEGESWWERLVWQWVWIAAVSLGTVAIFAKVSEDVAGSETQGFDLPIRDWVLAHHARGLDYFFGAVTWIGSPIVLGLVALAATLLLYRRCGLRIAAATGVAPVVAAGLVVGFKPLFGRARPLGGVVAHTHGLSFPSAHATGTTAVLMTIAYVLWRERMARGWGIAAAGLVALVVGLSRLYLDVQWATDVVGGWGVGMFVATLCAALYERMRPTALAETTTPPTLSPADRGPGPAPPPPAR